MGELGSWWFLGTTTLLLVNDHVLKARVGSWWTGKLSDVVGPVVVAGLLAALLDRRAAVVLTALGFTLLKTVPIVAVVAAPVLGGVTRTDPIDLVGLVPLVPLWRGLRRLPERPPRQRISSAPARGPQGPARSLITIVGVAAAVLGITATSYTHNDPEELRIEDGAIVVWIAGDHLGWHRSVDRGQTWDEIDDDAEPGPVGDRRNVPTEPITACGTDRCYRGTPG